MALKFAIIEKEHKWLSVIMQIRFSKKGAFPPPLQSGRDQSSLVVTRNNHKKVENHSSNSVLSRQNAWFPAADEGCKNHKESQKWHRSDGGVQRASHLKSEMWGWAPLGYSLFGNPISFCDAPLKSQCHLSRAKRRERRAPTTSWQCSLLGGYSFPPFPHFGGWGVEAGNPPIPGWGADLLADYKHSRAPGRDPPGWVQYKQLS